MNNEKTFALGVFAAFLFGLLLGVINSTIPNTSFEALSTSAAKCKEPEKTILYDVESLRSGIRITVICTDGTKIISKIPKKD